MRYGGAPLAGKEALVQTRDIIVIGASAGGVEALRMLCAGLPARLPAAVFVVQHLSPENPSLLPQVLGRAAALPVVPARDGAGIVPGTVTVAVPDHHLLLRPEGVRLSRGPYENRTRPAIDVLFRSAAVAYGSRVIGVVLTGLLDDGTDGLLAIHRGGGIGVVQDPADALWPSMPRNALQGDHVRHSVALAEMPALLARLCAEPVGEAGPLPEHTLAEDRIAAQQGIPMEQATPGTPSTLSCPQCGGVLNEIAEPSGLRYRCQIGHAFTALGLDQAQSDEIERGLAVAVRTHRERLTLFRRMQRSAEQRGLTHAAERWRRSAEEAVHLARVLEQAMGALALQRKSAAPP